MLNFLKDFTSWMPQFLLFFCLPSSSSLSPHSLPSPGSLSLHSLVPPWPPAPTLKVKFALGALQKDRTHRVQIVVAVTAQGPSACLCDLEWTSRVTDVRHIPQYARSGPRRAKPAEKVLGPKPMAASWAPCLCQGPCLLSPSGGQEGRPVELTGWRQNAQALSVVLHRVALSNIGTNKWKLYTSKAWPLESGAPVLDPGWSTNDLTSLTCKSFPGRWRD